MGMVFMALVAVAVDRRGAVSIVHNIQRPTGIHELYVTAAMDTLLWRSGARLFAGDSCIFVTVDQSFFPERPGWHTQMVCHGRDGHKFKYIVVVSFCFE